MMSTDRERSPGHKGCVCPRGADISLATHWRNAKAIHYLRCPEGGMSAMVRLDPAATFYSLLSSTYVDRLYACFSLFQAEAFIRPHSPGQGLDGDCARHEYGGVDFSARHTNTQVGTGLL